MDFWRRYWLHVRPFKNLIALSLVWITCGELVFLAKPYVMKIVLDIVAAIANSDLGNEPAVLASIKASLDLGFASILQVAAFLIGIYLMIEMLGAATQYFSRSSWLNVSLRINKHFQLITFDKLMGLPLSYHINERTGEKAGKMIRGVNGVEQATELLFYDLFPSVVKIPLAVLMASYFDWRIGVFMLGFVPLDLYLVHWYLNRSRLRREQRYDCYEEADKVANEALANITTVQAFGQERNEYGRIKELREHIEDHERAEQRSYFRLNVFYRFDNAIGMITVMGLSLWGLYQGRLSVGSIFMMLSLQGIIFGNIQNLVHNLGHIGRDQESIDRLFKILSQESGINPPANPLPMDHFKGAVTFENVSFSYGQGKDALKNCDLAIAPGEMVALVGPSGSGKTTFTRLLLRGYDVDAGRILVDGKDLREIDLQAFRQQIGIVSQSVEVFSRSIAENIAYGRPEATREQIIEAAKLANAHEFIMELPEGYDSIVGERGVNLSGGQVQRLGIARAVLRDPRLIIFDEATSNLDSLSEKLIQEAIEKIRQNRTMIVIAHRLSTVHRADRIVVLDAGLKVEEGDQATLLRKNGLYRKLCEMQELKIIV